MAAISVCDGCGKQQPMIPGKDGDWHKPYNWFERSDDDGIQTACCRECIDKIAKETNKTSVIRPV